MITKIAEAILQPHQQRVLDRLYADDAPHGIVAYHSTGSGKTLTALKALERALDTKDKRALMITPASLVTNVAKEQAKHGIKFPGKLDVMSYERASRNAEELAKTPYDMLIFDEAHRLRNADTSLVKHMKPIADNSRKMLMLTGTAGYNHPGDVTRLINIINPSENLPESNKDFEMNFVDSDAWKLKHTKRLGDILNRYVDVYETPQDSSDFPEVHRKIIHTEMSPEQAKLYRYLEKKLPAHLSKKLKENLPMSLQDSTNLNMFATGIRQASDSTAHHDTKLDPTLSTKLQAAVRSMAEHAKASPDFKGLAYSNYIDAGVKPYADMLRKRGIEPLVFTGGLSAKKKKELVDTYNAIDGKPKVLLVSSSGGEGLDLKGTRLLQVLEPHFNQAKIRQIEGRGARYKSHAHLPEDQRNLLIEQYHSTLPKTLWQKLTFRGPDTAIDDYLNNLSVRKQGIVDEMRGLIHG